MDKPQTDTAFAGSIPKLYETLLVPLIFEPYAAGLVVRLAAKAPTRVLEVAAGTGVVTRRMASVLPESAAIVATDLNQAMLDATGVDRRVSKPSSMARRRQPMRCWSARSQPSVSSRRPAFAMCPSSAAAPGRARGFDGHDSRRLLEHVGLSLGLDATQAAATIVGVANDRMAALVQSRYSAVVP